MFTHEDCGSLSHSVLDPHQDPLASNSFIGNFRSISLRLQEGSEHVVHLDIVSAVAGMGPDLQLEERSEH
jgi:hypothetical protein